MDRLHALVMAGGAGTRFWPHSRKFRPKQFLPLAGRRPLLVEATARTSGLVEPENLWILTRQPLVAGVRELLPELDPFRIVAEPEGRDTAPCLVLAAARLEQVDPNATMLILPSDQVIADAGSFRQCVQGAIETLQVEDGLLTFGIPPTHPATGYGYIRKQADGVVEAGGVRCHSVEGFREKPDRATAETYLASDSYYWNAGIFLWHLKTFRAALEEHAPDLAKGWDELRSLGDKLAQPDNSEVAAAFGRLRRISIDFALMEHAQNVRVVEATFPWDDVGSWRAIESYRPADARGNILGGKVALAESSDCTVLADADRVVAVLGVDGLVVVDTPDALLVCPRDRVEDVKSLVDEVRKHGWDEVL